MVIQHSNYYQSWFQLGTVQSVRAQSAVPTATARWSGDTAFLNDWRLAGGRIDWLVKPPAAGGATARWSGDQTYLNDWRLATDRIDWLAKPVAAPASDTALWTMLNGAHVSYRNDWDLLGAVRTYIAQGVVEPEITTDPSGPRPAPHLDEDEEEILILMAAAEYYGLFK